MNKFQQMGFQDGFQETIEKKAWLFRPEALETIKNVANLGGLPGWMARLFGGPGGKGAYQNLGLFGGLGKLLARGTGAVSPYAAIGGGGYVLADKLLGTDPVRKARETIAKGGQDLAETVSSMSSAVAPGPESGEAGGPNWPLLAALGIGLPAAGYGAYSLLSGDEDEEEQPYYGNV